MLLGCECPNCHSSLEVDARLSGSEISCPECNSPLTVPEKVLGPGTVVSGFRLGELLGRGGMGEVYRAVQISLDRDVAMKIVGQHLVKDKEDIDQFLQEMKTLAKFRHPNIVTAYEAGEDGGVLFLAMEFVPGLNMEKRLAGGLVLSEQETLKLAKKLGEALRYAWEAFGVLHMDIKPGNILVDDKGEPMLADFGLARSIRDSVATDCRDIVGTPNYMSPEQCMGTDDLDCSSDVYSLGATLYHILTGQIPFKANSPTETMEKVRSDSLKDPREMNHRISAACVVLLSNMMARDPEKRYPDWRAFLSDLDRVLSGRQPLRHLADRGDSVILRKDFVQGSGTGSKKIMIKAVKPTTKRVPSATTVSVRQPDTSSSPMLLFILPILAVVGVVVLIAVLSSRRPPQYSVPEPRSAPAVINPVENVRVPASPPRVVTSLRRLSDQELSEVKNSLSRLNPKMSKASVILSDDNGLDVNLSNDSGVTDLSAFAGQPVRSLDANHTGVADISSLSGILTLKSLNLTGCPVKDLSPIKGLKLESLRIGWNVDDLSPLRGMPVTNLYVVGGTIRDLSPLDSSPIRVLSLEKLNDIEDLKPLAKLPLRRLRIAGNNRIANLTPLAALPLKRLELVYCPKIKDVSCLSNLKLVYCDLTGSGVTDLSPIKKMESLAGFIGPDGKRVSR